VGDDPDAPWVLSTAPRHAHLAGFDLHANVAVPAADRPRLEQLCRYLLRPAVARHRLSLLIDGRVVLTLAPLREGNPLTGPLSALYRGGTGGNDHSLTQGAATPGEQERPRMAL
jgi:hypothetical protein